MACTSCSTGGGCSTTGCGSGGCASGGCNRLNSYDWLTAMSIDNSNEMEAVEVSFKSGASKGFFRNPARTNALTGDWVVVDTGSGYDVGKISLSGALVSIQMKKKGMKKNAVLTEVQRIANERDIQRMQEGRARERDIMIQSRVIARSLNVDMKVCDVEVQADHRKATFFYTADGRIDFRELIKMYAKDFHVKVEMRQIGARQESSRLGGIGSCGRELCCSTWLTDFKSVSTTAARYQNIAINQTKLSGQCGRLKCCLNYELDTYMEALDAFPDKADRIETKAGLAVLVKTDVFKGLLYYAYAKDHGRGKFYALEVTQVHEMITNAKKGLLVESLDSVKVILDAGKEVEPAYEDVTGAVELPPDVRKKKKKKKPSNNRPGNPNPNRNPNPDPNPNQNTEAGPNPNNSNQNRPPRPPNPNNPPRKPNPNQQNPNNPHHRGDENSLNDNKA